ncbi:MAG: hypothetical protein C0399_12475 [Syntrophus sp. (in: bacteria)]|nr:hypothetical protein [Syntrophus sp. (in: bacteria)]
MQRRATDSQMRKSKRKQRYYTILDMHELAAQHGGKCAAETFRTGEEKIIWICAVGHEWEALPKSIIKGHWCPVCGREQASQSRKTPLTKIEEIIAKKNLALLSCAEEYKNRHSKIRLKCQSCSQEWHTAARNLPTAKCPKCRY